MDRETKVEEILGLAEGLLVPGGYEHMSVAAIARELGIAPNSIYWYFSSKDELFVAVLRRIIERLAAKKPPKNKGLVAEVLWVTDQMYNLWPLRLAIRERARHSTVVSEFDTELDELVRRLLIHGIEAYVSSSEIEAVATTFLATVEGAFSLGLGRSDRHRTITFALNRLAGVN
jgi:AcrR family transcriptional regulator